MRCHHLRRHESSALDDLEDEKKLPVTNNQQVSRAGRIWNNVYNLGRTRLRDANEIWAEHFNIGQLVFRKRETTYKDVTQNIAARNNLTVLHH